MRIMRIGNELWRLVRARGKAVTKNVLPVSSSSSSSSHASCTGTSEASTRICWRVRRGMRREASLVSPARVEISPPFRFFFSSFSPLSPPFRPYTPPFPPQWPGAEPKHALQLASVTSDARDSRKPFQTLLSIAGPRHRPFLLPITPGLREFLLWSGLDHPMPR